MARTDLLKRALFDLRQKGKKQWLGRREKAVDYYRGEVTEYTQKYFDVSMHDKIPFNNINITKRVVDRISLVYSEPAKRNVDDKNYAKYTKNKNNDLLHAERMTNLLNLVLIKVSWRGEGFEYDIIRDFEVETDQFKKDKIVRVSFPLAAGSTVLGNTDDVWEQWSEDAIITFNNGTGAIISEEENMLHTLPFVVAKTTDGRHSFTDIEPATDLVSGNEAINTATANLNANIHFQSFGMTYAVGVPAGEGGGAPDVHMGPDQMTIIPGAAGDVNVGVLSPPDTVTSVKEAITMQYRLVSQNYHLSSAFVEGNTQAESGTALRTRNEELRDFRKESIAIWRDIENKIYNVERQMLFTWFGIELPDDFFVDFGEKEVILNQSEVESQNNFDLEHGLITPAQILQRRDPDKFKTLDEYQTFIDENKAVNAGPEAAPAVDLNSILQSS